MAKELSKNVDAVALMKDVLEDTEYEKLEKLNNALERGAEVKPREGCFFMEIKDKKLKKPLRLDIRK